MVKISTLKTDWFIGLLVILTTLILTYTGTFQSVEWLGYDLGVRFSSSKPANQEVVIVAIDDAALEALGTWPLPRDVLAQATDNLVNAKPSVIGFALPFNTLQSYRGLDKLQQLNQELEQKSDKSILQLRQTLQQLEKNMDTDQVFANSLSHAGRVVLALPYVMDSETSQSKQPELPEYIDKFKLRNVVPVVPTGLARWFRDESVPVVDKIYLPIEQLVQHVGGAGLINLGKHERQYVRSIPIVFQFGDSYLPSFTLMMAARNMHLSTRHISVEPGQGLKLANSNVHTDEKLRIYPRFYKGKKDKDAFKVYSILDVLNNKIPNSDIRDKTVLIGLTAEQHINSLMTPIGEAMAPVMIVAHAVSSVLNEELLIVPATRNWVQFLTFVVIGLYLMFLLPRFRFTTGLIFSVLLAVVLLNVFFYTMISESTWLPLMAPLCALLIGHMVLGVKHLIEGRVRKIHMDLSEANKALGQFLHQQGQLDQAFEKYRSCFVDTSLLNKLYNLGLDYERKRQFNKAVTVFHYIVKQDANYNDVSTRLSRNQEVSNQMLGSGGSVSAASNPGGTMVISHQGMEKPMLGRYKIDRELGRGAMGLVYLGHDPKIGRTVAIKTMSLSSEFEADKLEDIKQRFFREAETAGRLNHPNIVTIYDVGEDQELSYIAMDYLKGSNLLGYCKPDTLLPEAEVFDIMIEVAEALTYAHGQKVVHRDIKPANIIYDRDEHTITVTDFGVACLTDTSKTKTGTILGSPSYMSPEQLAGNKVDGRSDLFSLGVSLYQMLTGELPFIADSLASLMYKIANEKHPDIRMFKPDLPSCVSQIINKALHKEVERRFQSGEHMANALKRCRERLQSKNTKSNGGNKK
ncbi:MAG: serine/threonine-protein kinase [Gammaproteobacteria bacterium]|nr:serine/threonine-protein kinase [Gammaproteobacteria bacterium]